ncbi:hypothetical protein N9M73_06550 [Rhodobacteraceae bacterium]|nr:hypothetical protein [Paracoccaceae bacterium]
MLIPLLLVAGPAAVILGFVEYLSIMSARSKGIEKTVPARIWIQIIGGGLAFSFAAAMRGMF